VVRLVSELSGEMLDIRLEIRESVVRLVSELSGQMLGIPL